MSMDPTQQFVVQHHQAFHSFMGVPADAGQRQRLRTQEEEDESTRRRNECAREANRIHCKETRDRKRERERLLAEEVEVLTLYRAIVEDGPDLFSLHKVDPEASFSFLCESFYHRLQLAPEDILGRPLASIVDPRDSYALRTMLLHVVNGSGAGGRRGSRGGSSGSGSLINLRIVCGRLACQASMTVVVGSQGLVIVSRLYDV